MFCFNPISVSMPEEIFFFCSQKIQGFFPFQVSFEPILSYLFHKCVHFQSFSFCTYNRCSLFFSFVTEQEYVGYERGLSEKIQKVDKIIIILLTACLSVKVFMMTVHLFQFYSNNVPFLLFACFLV